ncbi:MAG: sulfatase family protein, partial [Bryobacteraceae bacterium]
ITGMHPTSIGTHHMRSKGVPPPYVKCFTEYLRAAGYYCTNNVKTDYNFDPPETAWDESSNRAHWRGRAKGQPFFAVFNHTVTHESQIRVEAPQLARNLRELSPGEKHDPAKATLPPYYPDTPIVRRDWANYYDLITAMDKQITVLLRQLEEDGEAANTIVFFYGDHGRGLPRAKRWIYDSGIRIPLLVRWPGKIAPGTVRDELVSSLDFAPTLLSLAGVEIPKHLQGQPFLGERVPAPRQYIYAARDRMDETYDIIRCVRDKRFKYIRNFQACKPYAQYIDYMDQMPALREMRRLHKEGKLEGAQKLFFAPEKPEEELYDVTADPHEVTNLAKRPEHRTTLERLRAAQRKWAKDTGDLGLVPEPELLERMRPGGKWSTTAAPSISRRDGKLRITCATDGASIAYTSESGASPRWKLYSREVDAPAAAVRAKACRLGYRDSEVVSG